MWRRTTPNYLQGLDIPLQPWAAQLVRERAETHSKDDAISRCLPYGMPRFQAFSLHKIFQTPRVVVVLYEYLTTFRQIFIDGRKLPVDPDPTWMGYSVGRWEGDTLVVETSGFNGSSWLDASGHPMTAAMRVTERIRRPDYGHLEVEFSFDDPKAYTRVWKATVRSELAVNDELIEYVCSNEKDVQHLIGK